RPDYAGRIGISALVKCTFVIRQMEYGIVPNALDEYLHKAGKAADVPFMANDMTYKRDIILLAGYIRNGPFL
ncbi:hypothetical protein Tco_0518625, partial [Tanacetum coccineum]